MIGRGWRATAPSRPWPGSTSRASRDRIVPLAFRTDGGPFFIGMIGFVALVAAAWIAKRTYWLVANRIGAHAGTAQD